MLVVTRMDSEGSSGPKNKGEAQRSPRTKICAESRGSFELKRGRAASVEAPKTQAADVTIAPWIPDRGELTNKIVNGKSF